LRGNPVLLELAQLLEAGLDPATAVSRIRADNSADTRALEQLGMTLRREGFGWDIGPLLLGDLGPGEPAREVLAELGIAGQVRLAQEDRGVAFPDYQLWKPEAYGGPYWRRERLKELFPQERDGLDRYYRFYDQVLDLVALARRVERRRSRTTRLRAQLWLPNAVLVIMLASNVVRALAAGTELSVALLDAALVGIPVFGIACAIVAATAHDTIAWLRMAWRTKLIDSSATLREYFNCTFFTLFAWQANAGVDLITGATTLAALIDDPRYRQQVERYRAALRRGESVTTALTGAGLLRGGELNEVLRVAEHAGRIGSALEHYLVAQGERLERITDIVFAWLPRAYYAVVFVLGGLSLL